MANERHKRLMQEALDDNLTAETRAELQAHLQHDLRDAEVFERLQQVDHLLRNAPHERAPQRLALSIMARLAQSVSPRHLTRISGLALALALALVAAVMMPLLVAAGWLLLSAVGNAGLLATAVQRVVALLAIGITTLQTLIQQIQAFIAANPELPAVIISLIPISLFWLLRVIPRSRSSTSKV